jgi:hypothetical protein
LASGVLLVVWLAPHMSRLWGIQFEPGLNAGLIAPPAAIASGCAVAWTLAGRRALWRGVPVALLVATLAWNVSLDPAQRDRQGSTTYFYGRDGQQATARALDLMLRPDETYVAAKDVAWYTRNQRYIDHESWKYLVWEVQGGEFDGSYLGHDIRILVLTAADPSFRTAYGGLLLRRGYALAGEYGDFQIYARR